MYTVAIAAAYYAVAGLLGLAYADYKKPVSLSTEVTYNSTAKVMLTKVKTEVKEAFELMGQCPLQ